MSSAQEVPVKAEGSVAPGMPQQRSLWGMLVTVMVFVGVLALSAWFYRQTFTSLTDRTAVDIAQIGRNIAQGRGFTTHLLRPFNVLMTGGATDAAELNNAPAMPYAVAAAFRFKSPADQVVVWVSLGLAMLTLIATYFLGRTLFDHRVGLLATGAAALSLPLLKAAVSGREWTMEALWFTLLLIGIALHHRATNSGRRVAAIALTVLSAVMVAALYATDYVLALLAIPVAVYFGVTGPARRFCLVLFVIVTIAAMAPLAIRNLDYTGFPLLGLRAWDVLANSSAYPGDTLYRSTDAGLREVSKVLFFPLESFSAFSSKLLTRSGETVAALASALGLAILPFALVSMLYRFKRPQANAVRGLMYGLVPLAIVTLGLTTRQSGAIIMFVPVAAVFSAEYFLLLLDAKKLHPVYVRMLIGGYVFLAGCQVLPSLFYPLADTATRQERAADTFFAKLGAVGRGKALVYTDAPWTAAWRTEGYGLWLPRTEDDLTNLSSLRLFMRQIVLTPESDKYPTDEVWYVLHNVRLWRTYIRDHDAAARELLAVAGGKPDQAKLADRYVQRLKRDFAISESLSGFVSVKQFPLDPDDIQVIVDPSIAPADRPRD